MTIRKERFGDVLDVTLEGRLDAVSSHLFENELQQSYSGLHELNINVQDLEYISSAGLRVLLSARRTMNGQGRMTVSGARHQVMEALDTTGFSQFLF